MNPTSKSIIAALAVLGATGSIMAGVVMRDRVDVGGANAGQGLEMTGLVASRDANEVPEGDYFFEITNLLKRRYVENIADERKLAIGAVRGMVTSLGDPDSLYLDKESFRVHRAMREGKFEGIGVQLELIYLDPKAKDDRISGQPVEPEAALLGAIRIPKVTVVTVVPGGPADKAGVKVGDYVEYIDDHWVPNAETVASFRKLQSDFNAGKVKWEELSKVQIELSKRTKKTLMPLKAHDKLLVGTEGNLNVVWRRGSESRKTSITRAASEIPRFAETEGTIKPRFIAGVADQIRNSVREKDSIIIDLRGNANGEYKAMREALAALAPTGTYGKLLVGKRELHFDVKVGNANPPKATLLVDQGTRGAAEAFALALVEAGIGTMQGKTAGHPILVEDYSLPDGSGYTLAIAKYQRSGK
jgi:carboxyl-terminal processing protease